VTCVTLCPTLPHATEKWEENEEESFWRKLESCVFVRWIEKIVVAGSFLLPSPCWMCCSLNSDLVQNLELLPGFHLAIYKPLSPFYWRKQALAEWQDAMMGGRPQAATPATACHQQPRQEQRDRLMRTRHCKRSLCKRWRTSLRFLRGEMSKLKADTQTKHSALQILGGST